MTRAARSAATGIAVEESGACGFSSARGAVAVLAHVKARPRRARFARAARVAHPEPPA